jgi:NAD(P)-dependent dehydrogenase (short-subunit alcohol dehydrogenase family)
VIVNHGTLGEVQRIADCTVKGWEHTFHVNLFAVVSVVQAALPSLRKSEGRIIFTSSGAAQNAYASWGAYGASKAALNHLAMTLKNEEPDVTVVSIRPGVVDTDMQKEIREEHEAAMDEKDREKFLEAKKTGKLLRPEQPGNVIAKLALGAPKELNGMFLSWNDEVLQDFQM